MKLEICDVSKQYKDKCAVDHANLTLTPGVWGLLGANGAGKTTLMRMIAGIMKPTGGEIRYDGIEIDTLGEKYRDIFGYLPQEFGFYPGFSVQDYLEYMATLKGLPKGEADRKIKELLSRLTLEDVKRKKISKLSGGMKRRVGIAQALLNDPEVLILDEPTSGLDPGERVRFRNLLSEFARDRIVLISTHIVSDIEYISTKNAVMKDGKVIVCSNQWRSLWIDIEVTKDIAPGNYEIELRLKKEGDVVTSAKQRLTVIGVELPKQKIMHTEWMHADCLADYYHVDVFSEEHWKILENYFKEYVKRGCNMMLTPLFTSPLDTAVGLEPYQRLS